MAILFSAPPLSSLFDQYAVLTPTFLPLGSQERSDGIRTAGKNMPLSHLISVLVRPREHTRL